MLNFTWALWSRKTVIVMKSSHPFSFLNTSISCVLLKQPISGGHFVLHVPRKYHPFHSLHFTYKTCGWIHCLINSYKTLSFSFEKFSIITIYIAIGWINHLNCLVTLSSSLVSRQVHSDLNTSDYNLMVQYYVWVDAMTLLQKMDCVVFCHY